MFWTGFLCGVPIGAIALFVFAAVVVAREKARHDREDEHAKFGGIGAADGHFGGVSK